VFRSQRLIRFFYRWLFPLFIMENVPVTDWSEKILVMEHELFKHMEIELFVPARHLAKAMDFVREAIDQKGKYTHHYPICIRRVLPDDALISPASGTEESYYAISFITYVEPRDAFVAFADSLAENMAKHFAARPHWGKYCPLIKDELEPLYPR